MRKTLLLGLCLALLGVGRSEPPHQPSGPSPHPIPVVATIQPLASWIRSIGGERVEVTILIPPGTDPHTFEPRPSQLLALHQARMLVRVGLHLEALWIDRVLESLPRDSLFVVTVGSMVPTLGDPPNPHVWLSLPNAIRIVDSLARILERLDPHSASYFRDRARAFIHRATSLHQRFQRDFQTLTRRSFIAQHPTWTYLARDYGLQEVAVLSITPGQEPGPRKIAQIIRKIREFHIPILLVEPQLPKTLAELLRRETSIQWVELDPLGVLPGHQNYLQMMQENLETLYEALKEAEE